MTHPDPRPASRPEPPEPAGRFRIGEFARLAGVTVRALRHYDHEGLLRPADVSPSGYRLYAPGQLATLRRILSLRALGCSLDEVRAVLHGPPEPYAAFLDRRRAALLAERDALDDRLARLDAEARKEHRVSQYTVQLKTFPAQPALAVRGPAPDYRHVTAPMNRLYERVCAPMGEGRLPDPGWSVVTWRGGGYQSEEEIELEVAIPVFAEVEGDLPEGVERLTLPETLVASTVHVGSYERFGEAYAALLAWMDRAGYAPAGPVREVYLRFAEREDDHLSELQVPVRRA